jgi:hypothetical protein
MPIAKGDTHRVAWYRFDERQAGRTANGVYDTIMTHNHDASTSKT